MRLLLLAALISIAIAGMTVEGGLLLAHGYLRLLAPIYP